MRTPKNVYRRFIEFEKSAAAIYLRLASNFSEHNPELSALWLEMAMEEKQHAGLLQFCLAEGLFAPELPEETKIRQFSALYRRLEKRLADSSISVNDAFVLAAELEGSEVNSIYCYLTTPLHRSLYLLRRKIASSPPDHLNHLVDAAKRFGAAQRTLEKLERLKECCGAACLSSEGSLRHTIPAGTHPPCRG